VPSLRDSFRFATCTRHLRAGLSYAALRGWNLLASSHRLAQNLVLTHTLNALGYREKPPAGCLPGLPQEIPKPTGCGSSNYEQINSAVRINLLSADSH